MSTISKQPRAIAFYCGSFLKTNIPKGLIASCITVIMLLFATANVKASHNAGLDISYECLGGNDSFAIQLSFYRDCNGIGAPPTLTYHYSSVSCGMSGFGTAVLTSVMEIIPYCPAALPTTCTTGNPADPESREQYIYRDTVALPGICPDWRISSDSTAPAPSFCCRNNAINTLVIAGEPIYVEAWLNNTIVPCNSSPYFTNPPAPFVYTGGLVCYNNGAVDINGDSLAYTFVTPKTGPLPGDTVEYSFPFTYYQPITGAINLDPATGDICMLPTDPTQVTVIGLKVEEYRYGTLIGSTMRDIQVKVIGGSDNLPTTNGINGAGIYMDTIAAGCAYSFSTTASDGDGEPMIMSSNVAAAIPTASFIVAGNGTPSPIGTFTWTPAPSDIGNTPHCFVTDLFDDHCPVNGSEYKAWCFTVVDFSANFTNTGPACIGDSMNFYSQYNYTGYTYSWDFGTGALATLVMASSVNPVGVTYATSGAKTVVLTISSPSGCTVIDTNVVTINPLPSAAFSTTGVSMSKCAGDTVSFVNLGSSGPGVTHAWDFGSSAFPASSNIENPAPTIYLAGTPVTATHTVTNQFGCASLSTVNFTVNPTPTADFASNAPSCTGAAVNFVNTGTAGAAYYWDFGSGASPATSAVENPVGVTYSTLGGDIKTVYLITTLGLCADSVAQTINVFETPAPSFTHDGPKCEEDLVTFTYTGTTGTGWTYNWDFGGISTPSSSNAQNPSPVVYQGAGTKTATLTVATGACSDTASATVVINQKPVADFASNAPSCTGDSVYFINTGTTGATAYAWDFGTGATPGTSSLENPSVVLYDTSGSDIKTVQLITTLGSCTDSISKTINITETPAPAFTHDASPNACEGAVVTFVYTGTTDPGWTYAWDFGAGATPPASTAMGTIEVTYAGVGAKTVTLTVTGVCSETTTSSSIVIVASPVADFSSTAPSCIGDLVDFANTGTGGASYAWNLGAGATPATSTAENPAGVSYSGAGIITVELVTTLGACTDTSTQTINLVETPAPAFTNDGPKCEGEDFVFTYTGTTGIGWTYAWDFGTGATPNSSSSGTTATAMYTGFGTKTVTLTVTNDICSATAVDAGVTVNEAPLASFASTAPACTGDSVDFTNTGSTGGFWTYSWSFDSGSNPPTSTDEDPAGIVYSTDGTKLVTLIVANGTCSDTVITPININLRPTASFGSTAPQCAGVNIDFGNTGSTGSNWSFLWDFGGNANPSTSNAENPTDIAFETGGTQTISFTISDQNCSETFTYPITVYSLPVADAGQDTIICANASLSIGAVSTSGNSYSWTPTGTLSNAGSSNPTASPTAPVTTYIVQVTDSNGCVNSDSIIVTMLQSAAVDAGPDVEICFGDTVQIGVGLLEGQVYSWSPVTGLDNPSISNPMANPQASTIYTVTVSFQSCPPLTDQVFAEVHPLPKARATDYLLQDTTYITLGNSVQLIATGGLQYAWLPEAGLSNPGLYNPVATPDSTTNYVVTVVDIHGCVNRDTVRVDVDSVDFWVPTAFTPDGNGFNDVFYIRIEDLETFELIVFDRWGEQVFISRDASVGWEGLKQFSGEKMPQGAYVYSFKGTYENGDVVSQSGLVNLIR